MPDKVVFIPVPTKWFADDASTTALRGGFALLQALTMGFRTAADTLMGQNAGVGAGRHGESVFRMSALPNGIVLTVFGLLSFFFAESHLFAVLPGDLTPDYQACGLGYIPILALCMPLMGGCFFIPGGLRGAGNTVRPLGSVFLAIRRCGWCGVQCLRIFSSEPLLRPVTLKPVDGIPLTCYDENIRLQIQNQ